jgi:tetratricopeptide (TPR) repeat protein
MLRKIKTPDLNEAFQDYRRRSRENAEAGRWESALREINYLIDLEYGIEAQDYAIRSLCNYHITRYLEGMFDGDKALELDSNCYDALSSRAYCRLYLGDYHGVKEDAEQLLKNPDAELIGLELRAEAYLRSGCYSDAIYDALSLGKKRPGYRRAVEILDEARSKAHQQYEDKRSR